MKCIIGLGNPESRYDGTRHNVGFRMLDMLAKKYDTTFTHHSKFRANIAQCTISSEKILLVKPTTYYNLVGESARSLLDFYHLSPSDVILIHDDLNLPLGTVRTRIGGSDGGNNGVKSLNAHIGLETARIRLGVWTERHHGVDKVAVVLGKFTAEERTTLDSLEPQVLAMIRDFVEGTFTATTHHAS